MNNFPAQWHHGWQTVPVTGRRCWLRWEDGSVDGPFEALAIIATFPSVTAGIEQKRVTRAWPNGKTYQENEWEGPLNLETNVDNHGEFAQWQVVLAVPPSWENCSFEFPGSKPEVHWGEPLLEEAQA